MKDTEQHNPPKWPDQFLRWFCRPDLLEHIMGDLQETFADNLSAYGLQKARRLHTWEVIRLFRPGIIRKFAFFQDHQIFAFMFRNYLKVTIRSFWRNRYYASLNTFGLAIGFAAFILLFIYGQHQSNYDGFHQKADRIYRITYSLKGKDYDVDWARLHADFINTLPERMPEVEELIRFQNHEKKFVRIGEDKFRPAHAYVTDAEVFSVFDFPFVNGDPASALKKPGSVVLTKRLAEKFFDRGPALGQTIHVTGSWTPEEVPYQVTGVIDDVPSNTHLPVDMFFSFKEEAERTGWAYVYILLKEGAKIETLKAKFPDFIAEYTNENSIVKVDFGFQALQDIHLHSKLAREIKPNGNALYVKVFFYIGIFILLVAMINFINLSSALSLNRTKEISVRRILGANSGQNLFFALTESVSYNFLALILGVGIAILAFPYFKSITGAELICSPTLAILGLIFLAIVCGVLSGLYPGWILNTSSDGVQRKGASIQVRRVLVGIQLTTAILLIGSALVAYHQFQYLRFKKLGLEQEKILAIPSVPDEVTGRYKVFKDRLLSEQGVQQVAACNQVPSEEIRDSGPVFLEGAMEDPRQAPLMDMQAMDADFVDMMDIEMLAGNLPKDHLRWKPVPELTTDFTVVDYINQEPRRYLINETAMKQLGFQTPEEAIGQQISWSIGSFNLSSGPIDGVVKDFHQETLKNKVDPLLLTFEPIWLQTFLVKVETKEVEKTVQRIKKSWDELFPKYPFEYYFLDEMYNNLYKSERIQIQLLFIFSGLSIVLALIGLFSLIAFALRTRMKEIAIRKVLGADLASLIKLLGREYLILACISAAIAVPVSYLWISRWLEDFAYRIEISPLTYLLAIGLVGALLLLTVCIQTSLGTAVNPVEKLKTD